MFCLIMNRQIKWKAQTLFLVYWDKLTFKDKLGYIKLLIYRNIYSGPLDSPYTRVLLYMIIIAPNEVFGDIMVLASPPRPPVDPDDANTLTR